MMDRLKLDDARLAALAASVRDIAEINDPVGEVADSWTSTEWTRNSTPSLTTGRYHDDL